MAEMIEIIADQRINAYLAMPTVTPKGAVIVIHEVWGLVDHIKSVADRYANEGYIALAPDLLFELDYTNVDVGDLQLRLFDPKTRSEAQPKIRELMAPAQSPDFGQNTTDRLKACFDYLYNLPETNKKVAVNGFCFGGSYSYALAFNEPRLKIAFPFYGHADQSVDEIKKTSCPIRAFYGEKDEGLMSSLDDLKKRMAEAGVDFQAKGYPNCGHAFFNDTNPFTYNKEAAEDAWKIVTSELARVWLKNIV